MKKFVLFAVLISVLIFAVESIAQTQPVPNVPQGCGDQSQPVKGHWKNLHDGQYGAENLDKLERGHKWKIAKREKNKIIFIWCEYFDVEATTEMLNERFAQGNAKFVKLPIRDSGSHKTTGFWIYK